MGNEAVDEEFTRTGRQLWVTKQRAKVIDE